MLIAARPCLLAGWLLGLPFVSLGAASHAADATFANGWRPAHVLQWVEREALSKFAQLECGQEMTSLQGSHERFAIVTYHPWSNPKLRAKRIVPVDGAANGKVGDHVMIHPQDCQKAVAAAPV